MDVRPAYWGDRLAKACAIYYGACGLLAAALDYAGFRRTGHWASPSAVSLGPMVWACACGLVVAAVAVASRPKSNLTFLAAIALEIMFGIGVIVGVALASWQVVP